MARRLSSKKKRFVFLDVVERYLRDVEVRLDHTTLKSYRHRVGVLAQLLTDVCQVQYLDDIEVDHLRQCTQALLNTKFIPGSHRGRACENGASLSNATVRGYIRVWKAFFSWCLQEGLIEINPADMRFKPPKQTKKVKPTFTDEHIQRMLAVFDTSDHLGFRNYVMLVLFLDTGMRLAELANLQVKDIHETYVKVLGKGRKEREIGIYPETRKLLWKYISRYRNPVSEDVTEVFLTWSGKPLRMSSIRCVMLKVQAEAGLEDIQLSAHVFRHTFAKMYLESGGDLFKLSREMGHSDVQVTKIYLEDFGSSEARKDHTSHSPIARLNLKKQHGKKKK